MPNLIKIKNFAFVPEAEMAQDILKQSGITSLVSRTNRAAAITEASSGHSGEADLLVKESDLPKAREIIEQYFQS